MLRIEVLAPVCLLLIAVLPASNGCFITIPTDMPASEPVLLYSADALATFQLFKPTGQVRTLPVNSSIMLLCPGSGNVITAVSKPTLKLLCRTDGNFFTTVGNQQYSFNQLGCKSIPTAELLLTTRPCANNQGYIYEAGFSYNTNNFATVFEICYNSTIERTFYSHNIVNGAAIDFKVVESTRHAFRANGMSFTTTATNNFYTTKNQIARSKTYFGNNQLYITDTMYMVRGHLMPDADFVFAYEQLATYFYTNVAPVFQVIKAGNWICVENLARILASTYGGDLNTYTGYMGQLKLPNANNDLISIYLDAGELFEAPKYFWKVVKDEATDAAIVFVTLNNPFATSVGLSEFCENICATAGVASSHFGDMSRGYTFCCSLSEFRNYVHLPIGLTASTLLVNPNNVKEPPIYEEERDVQGCTIRMPTDIPKNQPVYFITTDPHAPRLFKPEGELTTLLVGTKLTLSCAGGGNNLASMAQSQLVLTCTANFTFYSAEKQATYTLTQLGCDRIPTSELLTTSKKCGNNKGYVFEAGYPIGSHFASVFTVCYDNFTEHAIYTHNIINGAAIDYKVVESTRGSFRANGMSFTTTVTNNFYTINNQIARFEQYFGSQQIYVDNTMYMARGHLAPDADFVFSYEQLSTYFYTNVVPKFQIINAGNWVRVENFARGIASKLKSDVDSYTGYMGLLRLPDSAEELVPVYLDDGHYLEAPKYIWKVVRHRASNAAIVFITLNNPYVDFEDDDEFCENVCEQAGVESPFFSDMTRGYTFCCRLSEFKMHCEDLPADVDADYLLGEDAEGDDQPPPTEEEDEAEGCVIAMPIHMPKNEPVYFTSSPVEPTPRLFKPKGKETILPFGTKLTLTCGGGGNNLAIVAQGQLELTCTEEFKFYSLQKRMAFTLNQLGCDRIPTADLLITSTACGDNQGYLLEVGYALGTNFGSVFTICYNNVTEHTVYSRNIINGATINFKVIEGTRRAFRANGMSFTTAATNNVYTINNQIARFKAYFGPQQQYIDNNMYLARGHLTPDADFVFSYEQLATYFYANVAPQFQVIHAGNWLRVENSARFMAANFGSSLLTFTGTLGVLELPDSINQLQPIYLDNGHFIEAPKWFYKVLIHPELQDNVVMITLNNPFARSRHIVPFCANVCKAYGLDTPQFHDPTRGYTFCCTLTDFQTKVTGLPTFDLPDGWVIFD